VIPRAPVLYDSGEDEDTFDGRRMKSHLAFNKNYSAIDVREYMCINMSNYMSLFTYLHACIYTRMCMNVYLCIHIYIYI
jgi:hypothetical protein